MHGFADLVVRRLERARQAKLGDDVRRAVSYYMAPDDLAVALLGHHLHESVITSYSIHYTKLYEVREDGGRGTVRRSHRVPFV